MTAGNRREASIPRQEISETSCQLKFPDGKYHKIEIKILRQEISEN